MSAPRTIDVLDVADRVLADRRHATRVSVIEIEALCRALVDVDALLGRLHAARHTPQDLHALFNQEFPDGDAV